ncbi:MAG: ribosomal RNA small subunit methyltransferase A [Deltaproteobacteria bacterium]|nr:ribosomal RNA small subunit methyltransferase A [Deltaproteobacteria bacterium]
MSVRFARGLKPNKRLGQHFLVDQGIIKEIIAKTGVEKSDDILEIGPGLGALTIPMAKEVNSITAVEKDSRMVNHLRQRLEENSISNVLVIEGDILRVDFDAITGGKNRIKVIGNLPYNISSPFLERLITNKKYFSRAVLMLQYEFAERLCSGPGTKDYGAITVMTQYESTITRLIRVDKDAFSPRPKVGSMVISIDLEMPHPVRVKNNRVFELVVRGAFAQRRKTIKNSLKVINDHFENDQIAWALDKCGIDPLRRAETVSLDEFISLSDTLSEKGSVF